jgi:hypothetical protein
MYHVGFGLFLIAAVFFLPGFIIGVTVSFFKKDTRKKWRIIFIVLFFAIVESAILYEKHLPFFFGNICSMVLTAPYISLHMVVGLIGDGLWVWRVWAISGKYTRPVLQM